MKQNVKDRILELYEKYGDIEIICDGSSYLPIDSILDFQGDLKKLSEKNLIRLCRSIFVHNFIAPFFVWNSEGDWKFLDGHSRGAAINAIRESGVPIPGQFPVVEIKAKSEKQAREYLLAVTSQYGEFQKDVLDEWIADIDCEIAESLRIVDTELELAIASLSGDTAGDDVIPEDVDPVTKLGDLWELGNHRLLCGDATKVEDVDRLMNGQKADMVFTSPPYNGNTSVGFGGSGLKDVTLYQNNKSDNKDPSEYIEFNKEILYVMKKILSEKGLVFYNINYNKNSPSEYIKIVDAFNEEISLIETICWEKQLAISLAGGNLTRIYEFIFLFSMNKKADMNKKTTNECIKNLWKISNIGANTEDHKACFPVELVEFALKYYSFDNFILYEPFGGTGTTLIACEKSGRIAQLVELDPHYCDVIINRFAQWCKTNNRECSITRNGEPFEPV